MAIDISKIDFGIVSESAAGVYVNENGTWSQGDVFDTDAYLKKFTTFERSIGALSDMVKGKAAATESDGQLQVVAEVKEDSFGSDGTIQTKLFTCPECGKRVKALNKNGYCSKGCAAKAKAARVQSGITNAGNKTLEIIDQIQQKLALLDAVLNLLTELPELIKMKAKLPEEYREYVTLRIDDMFLRIKIIVNLLMIQKNDLLIELMKKIKFGSLDKVLENILQPIKVIMTTIAGIQQALNAALTAIMALLNMPTNGPIPPESMGWFLTAKSIQHPRHSSEICIPVIPEVNKALPKVSGNMIDYNKIDAIVKKALPPIQEFEYFIDPAAFKVRYALSQDNGVRVKKMWEMLEALLKMGAEILPRYRDLKLTNPWYVIAILTSWAPLSRECYGDFIFHGSV